MRRYVTCLIIAKLGLVLAINPVLAQDLSPISDMLETFIDALTGPIGRGLAIIAVIASGFAMFIGRLNWMYFIGVLIGGVLVFTAEGIVDGFAA